MADHKLDAQLRTEFGKGAARRARRAHQIPAVIYGHGAEPLHVNLPGHQTMIAVRAANALLTLNVDGEEHLALVKDVQRDPVLQIIEHVDLLTVRRGEKVTVDVPVVVTGEVDATAVATQEAATISVEAEATHVPAHLEVDVEGRTPGQHLHASDIKLPSGVSLLVDAETMIVNVSEPVVADLGEEAPAAEGAEAAEGEEAAKAAEEAPAE
ncbi:50S ribosomal protein L25/general stress protein Ctc [Paenarthrobacter sp. DKR-5]|uniref:50S ribosomal protein L25/general stress protein Ctc n=1 Tax=Paenarthrobacter sp. DKR-5 TaxID=2835535 RepID=UPI001BDCE0FE|nr:50S ribosomal protein L25/general stress protein Ctc [Paenarthrobacter sp. DKR-5]MBT1002453.1 50S ribosomal protein L25/general stress protein Ctc [Paenarthrobacter sp. DKR-5]